MNDLQKRTWAEISLENIRHNYRAIRSALPEGCRFLGVVKADAYGHGAIQVGRWLQDKCRFFGVSSICEALELRQSGLEKPILILGHTPTAAFPQIVGLGIRPAEVWGCSKKPRLVSSAISLRMVAEEKSISGSWAMVLEPTGSAVRI